MRCSTAARMQFRPSPRVWLRRRARHVRRQPECHLYFARRVTFLSCADTPVGAQCQHSVDWSSDRRTFLKGSSGDNSADERSPVDAARRLADLFDEDFGSNTRLRSRRAA
jgi:hypothetical protein